MKKRAFDKELLIKIECFGAKILENLYFTILQSIRRLCVCWLQNSVYFLQLTIG
jgi:hypothetical protein